MRSGIGYDVHKLEMGRKLILGGIEIKHDRGLLGHSDADVLLHAITDALLGAAAMGDIGKHFPDTDPQFKDIDSRKLLRATVRILTEKGFKVGNIDVTVIAEAPKLAPYTEAMRKNISADVGIDVGRVNVKAITNEAVGFIGRGEAIAAQAIATLIEP